MRGLLQRVTEASVSVNGRMVGQIQRGFLVLCGVTHADSEQDAETLANKIVNLRVFEDAAGQMNRSLLDLETDSPGSVGVLLVSQFTLYADSRKGRRPSFIDAAPPEQAEPLVCLLGERIESMGVHVERGSFGAHMSVALVNDGPVTIWLDTADLRTAR